MLHSETLVVMISRHSKYWEHSGIIRLHGEFISIISLREMLCLHIVYINNGLHAADVALFGSCDAATSVCNPPLT